MIERQREGGEEARLDSLKATDLPSLQVEGQGWRARTLTHTRTATVTL